MSCVTWVAWNTWVALGQTWELEIRNVWENWEHLLGYLDHLGHRRHVGRWGHEDRWHILVTAGNVCISCITADTLLMLSLGILRSLGTLGSLPVVCYKFTRDTWVTSFTLWPSRHTWDLGVTWSEHWGACGGHLIHSVTWGTSLWGTGTGAIHLLTGDTFVTCTLGPSHLGHLGHCPEAGSVARLGSLAGFPEAEPTEHKALKP